ncbi:DUF6221 family protein [Streptomyces griseoluteus]|uniref:DUF6221 family protein n=1 Tax=Streptomyces griseoluteus TaxID=29306 RepID=UPI003445987E
MDDLVQWLTAQLDVEDRVARAAAEESHPEWSPGDKNLGSQVSTAEYGDPVVVGPWDYLDWDVRQHIAAHDPARVLREIDAKRRVMKRHHDFQGWCAGCGNDLTNQINDCPELRDLASTYADRPGFREEWRP